MAIRIAKLVADLFANTSQFDQGLNKSRGLLGRIEKDMKKSLKGIDTSFGGLGKRAGSFVGALTGVEGAIAGLASGAGLALLIKGATDSAGALQDQADSLQMSTQGFQEFVFAARQSGLSQEEFVSGVTKLNAKIADGELPFKNATEALYSIAEATKNAKDGTEKLAIANDAFGAKAGAKFIPLLNEGADGLRALAVEAERTGSILSASTIEAAKKFGDQLEAIGTTIKVNFQQGFLDEFIDQTGNMREAFTDPAFAQGIKEIGTLIGTLAKWALEAAAALGKFVGEYKEFISLTDNDAINIGLGERSEELGKEIETLKQLLPYAKDRNAAEMRLNALILERKKILDTMGRNVNDTGVNGGVATPGGTGTTTPPTAAPTTVADYISSEDYKKKLKAQEDAIALAKKQAESVKDLFASLEQENEVLKTQTDLYGQNKGAIESATKAVQIKYQLQKQGIKLSAAQQKALDDELATYQILIDKQEEQQKQTEAAKRAAEEQQRIWNDFADTLEKDFREALKGGKNFVDILNDIVGAIEDAAIKAYVTGPIIDALFGAQTGGGGSSGSGILGQLVGSIGSFFGFGSHAAGISYINRDQMVRVHKGEEIVNRRDVERGGRGGGMEVNIVNNNPDNKVSASPSSDGEGLDVVIDRVVGKKLSKRGTATNNAMRSQIGQTLIRR